MLVIFGNNGLVCQIGSALGAHGVPSFPHASVLPLGMSSITYTVPGERYVDHLISHR